MDFNLVSYEKYLQLVSRCLFVYFLMVSRCMIFNCLFTKRVRSILLFLYFAYYFCLINNKNFYILIIFKLVSWFTYIDIFLYWYHVGRIYFIAYLDPFVDDWKKRGEVFEFICIFIQEHSLVSLVFYWYQEHFFRTCSCKDLFWY